MKKRTSFLGIILIILISACMFSACDLNAYRGEEKDLYTVAMNNVFGTRGYWSNGELTGPSRINVIETDDYGRTLFFYSEYDHWLSQDQLDYGMAFVIMQKSDEEYAYYYPDVCYKMYFDTTGFWSDISGKLPPDFCDELKKANDWNKELDEDKCLKAEIVTTKPKGELPVDENNINRSIYFYEIQNGFQGLSAEFRGTASYSEKDRYGRELYLVSGTLSHKNYDGSKNREYYRYAIILNADGVLNDCGIVKILTPMDSAAAIRALKESNSWNVAEQE